MTQYANTNFTSCIKEVDLILDLTKVVLVENSVLDNINEVKQLDDFVKNILKEKEKQKDLDFDKMLKKIQGRIRSAIKDQNKVNDQRRFIEQTILL